MKKSCILCTGIIVIVALIAASCVAHIPWNMDSEPADNQQLAITITSDPEGIEIFHNETLLGITPLTLNRFWVAQHDRIIAKEAGYRSGIYEFYQGSEKDHWPTRQYVKLEKEKSETEISYRMHFKLRRGTDLGQKHIQTYGVAALVLLLILI